MPPLKHRTIQPTARQSETTKPTLPTVTLSNERLSAIVQNISNARHLYVDRRVERRAERYPAEEVPQALLDGYEQEAVDVWNDMHPALLALWSEYRAGVKAYWEACAQMERDARAAMRAAREGVSVVTSGEVQA